jgi:putative YhbY family RNA-binding protein
MTTTDAPPDTLDSAERRALRARAHHLHPLVLVGDSGVTPGVQREVDHALRVHELIKVRISAGSHEDRSAAMDVLCSALGASPVQVIGKVIVLFRPKPEVVPAPARRARGGKGGPDGRRTTERGRTAGGAGARGRARSAAARPSKVNSGPARNAQQRRQRAAKSGR